MPDSDLPLTPLHEIDQACDAFEAAWASGSRPKIEDFLGIMNGTERSAKLTELIALEVILRSLAGEVPSPDDYRARFPGESAVVRSAVERGLRTGETYQDSPRARAASPPSEQATPTESPRWQGSTLPLGEIESRPLEPTPVTIGRFERIQRIAPGGFSDVYRGWDPGFERVVAIKVPRRGPHGGFDAALLNDARSASKLSHHGIVRIFEPITMEDGRLAVAMQYVAGTTLDQLLRRERFSPTRSAILIRKVAEAVQHAHEHDLVHRDLKPSNVLIDEQGEPIVADFGLAIEGGSRGRPGEVAGTPPYMAPEQVRGETHRIQARTDIWAIGVMLYRALTGELPFPARERAAIFDEVLHRNPPSPRRLNPDVPVELARITMRCLSKRMEDRHETARELAQDLAEWLKADLLGPVAEPGRHGLVGGTDLGTTVLSKGLRSYDGEDAGFFLSLMPGPRGRGGFPESLRFWKERIESRSTGGARQVPRAFSVGVLSGPSGGGKSSVVRAGLLPRLDESVRRVFVEATPSTTEARLLAELRQEIPELPTGDDLAEAVAAVREARAGLEPSGKVLLVIDQFEQWLQAHPVLDLNLPLVRALRQCDGARIQALLLVREDFWPPLSRFFRLLEVRLSEGVNLASVELPDVAHARHILVEFGRACGRLPRSEPLGPAASQFLDEAVEGLRGLDGRVVPVRLSLFHEVARRHDWDPDTLKKLGGMSGIGVTYLKQSFDSPSAPPASRSCRKAAQKILRALLPAPGAVIRGVVRSATALAEAAELADRPHESAEVLRILDTELRLMTEVDPEGIADGDSPGLGDAGEATAAPPGERYYQLVHDDLVSSIRNWLAEDERSTSQGRARLRLATITAVWSDSPGSKRLPSLTEWIGILWHVPPRLWSPEASRMLTAASRHHAFRIAAAAFLLVSLSYLGRTWQRRADAKTRAAQVLGYDLAALRAIFSEIDRDRDELMPLFREAESDPGPSVGRRINVLVLLFRLDPTPERAKALCELACSSEPEDLVILRETLASAPGQVPTLDLWAIVRHSNTDRPTRLRAASVLAALQPAGPDWAEHAPAIAAAWLAEEPGRLARWLKLLDPAASGLLPKIAEALSLTDVQPSTFRPLILALTERGRAAETVSALIAILDEFDRQPEPPLAKIQERDLLARRRASAVAALAELGTLDRVWPMLRHREDPRLRAFLIDILARFAVNPRAMLDRLKVKDIDATELQGVLMALGEMVEARPDRLDLEARRGLAESAKTLALEHDDPGVHSAAGLVLRRIGRADLLAAAEASSGVANAPVGRNRWYVGPNGHAFAVAQLGSGWIGAQPYEEGYDPVETRQYLQVGRTVAVSTTEVTFGQIRRLHLGTKHDRSAGPWDDHPANSVNWYLAVRYCNHLSDQAGLPRCYPEPIGPGMTIDAQAVQAGGYRLPTEAEWELLCRTGTVTSKPFGDSDALQDRYACGWVNSGDRTLPVGRFLPNELGLFDTLGNVWEWCHDGTQIDDPNRPGRKLPGYPKGTPEVPATEPLEEEIIEPPHVECEPSRVTYRGLRGGAYDYANSHARSGKRSESKPGGAANFDGFRIVRTITPN